MAAHVPLEAAPTPEQPVKAAAPIPAAPRKRPRRFTIHPLNGAGQNNRPSTAIVPKRTTTPEPAKQRKRFFTPGFTGLLALFGIAAADVALTEGNFTLKPAVVGTVKLVQTGLETDTGKSMVAYVGNKITRHFELDKPVTEASPEYTTAIAALKIPTLQKALGTINTHATEGMVISEDEVSAMGIDQVYDIAKAWVGLPRQVRATDTSTGTSLGILLERMDALERLDARYASGTEAYNSRSSAFYRLWSDRETAELSADKASRLLARLDEAERTGVAATCSFTSSARPSINDCEIVLAAMDKGQRVRVLAVMPGTRAAKPFSLVNPDAASLPTDEAILNVVIPNGPWKRFGL